MIFKDIENLNSSSKEFTYFLIYGSNREKINLYLERIASIYLHYNRQYLDFSNLEQVDILKQEILNHDMFSQKKIFVIDVPYPEKVFKKVENISSNKVINTKIIFKASELKKNSKFRILFEKSSSFACLPCYENNQTEIKQLIKKTIKSENLKIDENLLNAMVVFFHQNKCNITNEIEKIVIFMKSNQKLDEESFLKISNTNNNFELENLVYAIVSGELKKLDILFRLKNRNNFSNIVVVNSLVNHLYKLIYFKEKYALTGSKHMALKSLKPPIFFKYEDEFITQSKFWTIALIQETLKKLFYVEKKLKTQTSFKYIEFVFFSIAKFANKLKY